jgi:hypothetical protein
MSAAIPSNIIQSFRLSGNDGVKDDEVQPDRAGRFLHPVQPDIPGVDEIAYDSDTEDYVEELVFIEECAELQEEPTSNLRNKPWPFAPVSLFCPSTGPFLMIHTILVRIGLKS